MSVAKSLGRGQSNLKVASESGVDGFSGSDLVGVE